MKIGIKRVSNINSLKINGGGLVGVTLTSDNTTLSALLVVATKGWKNQ